jgi:hypothetical protein
MMTNKIKTGIAIASTAVALAGVLTFLGACGSAEYGGGRRTKSAVGGEGRRVKGARDGAGYGSATGDCVNDRDCKGDRICENGVCKSPR